MRLTILDFVGPTRNADGQETDSAYEHRMATVERRYTHPLGRALRQMLEGWEMYAIAYRNYYDHLIGDDGVLDDHWRNIGVGLYWLLEGHTGGFDGGSIAVNINRILVEHGCRRVDE